MEKKQKVDGKGKVNQDHYIIYEVGNDCNFPCLLSFQGLVNRILSARFWIPLSRLTYCAYLVHIIALIVVAVSYENVQAYSDVHTVSDIYSVDNSHESDLCMI